MVLPFFPRPPFRHSVSAFYPYPSTVAKMTKKRQFMPYTWADVDYLHYNTQLSQNLIYVTVLLIKKYIFESLLRALEASTPRHLIDEYGWRTSCTFFLAFMPNQLKYYSATVQCKVPIRLLCNTPLNVFQYKLVKPT